MVLGMLVNAHAPIYISDLPTDWALESDLARLEARVRVLEASQSEVQALYKDEVAPIEALLVGRARTPALARRAAWALVVEAKARDLSPRLIAGVLRIENPWLVTDTASFAGAVGWMQVMPSHLGERRHSECGPDLSDGPTSVCYGADVLRWYIGAALDDAIRIALLRYNGCVRTPGCERYADDVLAAAGAS